MAIIVHLLCFTRWILFVVFHVYVVSHVFTTEKHVSFIFQKVNLCVQLILIFRGCSFCLPKFRTCSSLVILIWCDVKLVSLNVKGIGNFKKRRTIYTWCRRRKVDIIFLQETHSKKETEIQWKNEWGGKMLFSHGSSNSWGTAILIKNTINCTIMSTISDPLGRYIISKIQIDDKLYVFVNVYAPNKDKDSIQFFKKLYILLQTEDLECEDNIILGGDFNCPLNPSLDKRGGIMIPRKAVIESIECL